MSKITIDLEPKQIIKAFRELSLQEKLKLTQEFEKETRRARWGSLITKIRSRTKKNPISQREINRTCKEVRQKLYGQRAKGST
ncbi:MAG: hypothetical protein KJ711_04970 [Candidatus Omnitrophica bacterium]|nr:hypothetical protein [Candidatus Omnitrophota bacterium]MBU1523893.1 hypothetical protein [Candidatus Omnitrophota bacterium]